jgi:hypothetical protein
MRHLFAPAATAIRQRAAVVERFRRALPVGSDRKSPLLQKTWLLSGFLDREAAFLMLEKTSGVRV